MQLTRLAVAAVVAFLTVMSERSPASVASYTFSGTVDRIVDPIGRFADVALGDTVTGSFRYTTTPADWDFVGTSQVGALPPSGNMITYLKNVPTGMWDLTITVVTSTTSISNKDTSEPQRFYSVQLTDVQTTGTVWDTLAIESYQGDIFLPIPLVTEAILNFRDVEGDLFFGDTPPSDIKFTHADQHVGQFSFLVDTDGDGQRETRSFVSFDLNRLDATVVPEPMSTAIWSGLVGITGIAAYYRRKA